MSYPPPHQPPPLPVAPLAYDSVPRPWHPSIITAIGVLSIVIACFSALVSLYSSLASVGFYMMSQVAIPPAAIQASAATLPSPTPVPTVTVGGFPMDGNDIADGLAEQPRKNVMRVLEATVPLNEARVGQLDALMKFGGKLIFPSAADGATLQNIKANITESGRMPGADGAPGPQFFVVGTGKIEVYDDHAVFRPDGSADVISITAPDPTAAPTTSQAGSTVSDLNSVTVQPLGAPPVTITNPGAGPMFKINPLAGGASILASLVSLGLAVYLFVIGILTLKDSPSGAKLHWIYVLLKTPQVIISAIAGWWVAQGFAASITTLATATGTPPPPVAPGFGNIMATWAVIFAFIALAYPIGLIFALRSRTVREYYAAIRRN